MDKLFEKALSIKELVDYSDSSVVSREIMKSGIGNVSLFAFDKGEGLSEHTSPYNAMVLILEGSAEITIGGQKHNVSEGHFIIMPHNKPHALQALSRFKMLLIMIESEIPT